MHNNRQFALKFYASQADFTAEMMAYKELGGEAPVLSHFNHRHQEHLYWFNNNNN
jgi:hypothetical protein